MTDEFVRTSRLCDVESRTPIAHSAHQATDRDVREAIEKWRHSGNDPAVLRGAIMKSRDVSKDDVLQKMVRFRHYLTEVRNVPVEELDGKIKFVVDSKGDISDPVEETIQKNGGEVQYERLYNKP